MEPPSGLLVGSFLPHKRVIFLLKTERRDEVGPVWSIRGPSLPVDYSSSSNWAGFLVRGMFGRHFSWFANPPVEDVCVNGSREVNPTSSGRID